jgi:hypothetical protein
LTDEQLHKFSKGDWAPQELLCSPSGQVLLMEGERSVFQINADIASQLKSKRTEIWTQLSADDKRKLVRETIGISSPLSSLAGTSSPAPAVETVGKIARDGYVIHKIILTPEPGLSLPALAFVPEQPRGIKTLYLHGTSMKTDAAPGGPIESLVKEGQIVLAAELRGIGETETGHGRNVWGRIHFGQDIQEVFIAYLLGRSYVGMRAEDVAHWASFLKEFQNTEKKPHEMHLVGIGEAAIPALHAAALEPEAFRSVTLSRMLRSWEELAGATETHDQAVNIQHGALRHYDLPDLVELIGAAKVRFLDSVNALGKVVQTNK